MKLRRGDRRKKANEEEIKGKETKRDEMKKRGEGKEEAHRGKRQRRRNLISGECGFALTVRCTAVLWTSGVDNSADCDRDTV